MADYGKDLAYIHDAGFLGSPRRLGRWSSRSSPTAGSSAAIVELGSGSGATAQALTEAGHRVLGIDASRAMVELARRGRRRELPRRLVGGRQAPSVRRRDRDRRGAGLRRLRARPRTSWWTCSAGCARHCGPAGSSSSTSPRGRAGRRAVRLPGRRRLGDPLHGHRVGRPAPAAHHRVPPDRGRGDVPADRGDPPPAPLARSRDRPAAPRRPLPRQGPPRLWQGAFAPGHRVFIAQAV